MRAPGIYTARRVAASPSNNGGSAAAFKHSEVLGTWNMLFSMLVHRGSHACVPTRQHLRLPEMLQGSLPACRAQLWPNGVLTRWTIN